MTSLGARADVIENVEQGRHGPGLDRTAVRTLDSIAIGQLGKTLPGGVVQGLSVGGHDSMEGGDGGIEGLATASGKLELGSQEVAHHPQPLLREGGGGEGERGREGGGRLPIIS